MSLECERCGQEPDEHSTLHWCDNQSFRWVDSEPDTPPMSMLAVDGTTAVAWGERDGVLYILDVYEVEASCAEPLIPSCTFRPMFLPQHHRVSWRPSPILAALTAICTSALAALLLRTIIDTIRRNS